MKIFHGSGDNDKKRAMIVWVQDGFFNLGRNRCKKDVKKQK
jgi:hypothetical protein